MKSLVNLLQRVLEDFEDRCHVSTLRDLKTIADRVEDEGLSFLTITLSNYGSDFQKALDRGYVARDLFTGFQFKGGLPLFLGGFLELVFDRVTGLLHPSPSIDAIYGLRQITLMWSKVKLDVSKERQAAAIQRYMECESDVRNSDRNLGFGRTPFSQETGEEDSARARFIALGSHVFGRVFAYVDREIYSGNLHPKHGSGSTADRLLGNKKFELPYWSDRLEAVFPAWEYARANGRAFLESPVEYQDPGSETPVRVITVPKTMKTPRIIAMEPTHMQYMQQALLAAIVEGISQDKLVSALIGFGSQVPNQNLARKGSRYGTLATLDLSEASDRVSNQHVLGLLSRHSLTSEAVQATRSRKADVRGHGVIRLAKFASMGSALCFPFEAMVFCTIVLMGIERELGKPLNRKSIQRLVGQVRIYGDDIIVPVKYTSSVISMLETFGFKVNAGKSFWTGKFRESCGKDYYDGVDITVVRLRSLLPTKHWSKEKSRTVRSVYELRNQLYKAGLWKAVRYLEDQLSDLKWPDPILADDSSGIGYVSFIPRCKCGLKWHSGYQVPLVTALVEQPRPQRNEADGWAAMLKFFLKRSEKPIAGEHLIYSGRPRSVDIKLRRVDPRLG